MKPVHVCCSLVLIAFSGVLPVAPTLAQTKDSLSSKKELSAPTSLFGSQDVLSITLKGNLRALFNDQSAKPVDYPMTLSYYLEDSTPVNIPVQIKQRGHFRRQKGNCNYPPLLIQFSKGGPQKGTLFSEQKKLKLVMPCRGDEYVIREWLVYKLYNLVTPKSFQARLVRVTLNDSKNSKKGVVVYGVLLEEEAQMAARNHLVSFERKLLPQQTEQHSFITMACFQYLIGNTDWSVEYQQNIKFIGKDSLSAPYPVAYDFDHAGIVSAPYAQPAEELQLQSVRERRYRGYCINNMSIFETEINRYNQLKKEIYATYSDCPLLDSKYIKFVLQFLDDFYATINNSKALKKAFTYPCDPNGTGNVVIKGLKSD